MKKVLIAAALSSVFLLNAAFASKTETKKNDIVSSKVEASFKQEFAHAKEVNWQKSDSYYKATFKMNDAIITSYFTADGELMGIAHNILSTQLPINLQTTLKNDYDGYWISDLFEYTKGEDAGYFVTLESADQTLILESTNGSTWSVYRKVKKQ